ncbi:MAG: hypothetical protein DDG60_07490 [Anaerolineae bacterium]|nr:MAG: hypothetical protein DDG60_07490 [Anaerolineae bacterium]
MNAIVIAGGIPLPEDPLYTYTEGRSKAMLDIAGKPMIQWVLDALSEAHKVDKVILIGLSEKIGLRCAKPIFYVSNQGRMLENIVAGVEKSLELNPQNEYVLIVSSDIPALRGEMVDWLVEQVQQTPADVYYGVVPRDVMEQRYPNSKRTWTRLKEMEVCGADINACHVRMATEHLDLWEDLIGNRKSPIKQIMKLGLDTVLLLLLRRLTIDEVVQRASQRLGIHGKAIVWPWAEAGMDVDKPHQLELMREDLERTLAKTSA